MINPTMLLLHLKSNWKLYAVVGLVIISYTAGYLKSKSNFKQQLKDYKIERLEKVVEVSQSMSEFYGQFKVTQNYTVRQLQEIKASINKKPPTTPDCKPSSGFNEIWNSANSSRPSP